MAKYLVTDTQLANVASALRTKGETEALLTFPDGFVSAISELSTAPNLSTKTITENGTYTASADEVDGYSSITVDVPSPCGFIYVTYTAGNTCTATKGDIVLTAPDTSGYVTFGIPAGEQGTWAISDGEHADTAAISGVNVYAEVELTQAAPIVSWSSGSDSEVAALIALAHSSDFDLRIHAGWSVGDVRVINISAFDAIDPDGNTVSFPTQTMGLVISDFNDYRNAGAVMQLDFENCLDTAFKLSPSADDTYQKRGNNRAFTAYTLYTSLIPALLNALPSYLTSILLPFTWSGRYRNNVRGNSGSSYIGSDTSWSTSSSLAIRSYMEVFGENRKIGRYSEALGGSDAAANWDGTTTQIEYYKTLGNRIKRLGQLGQSNITWLTRSYCWQYYYNNDSYNIFTRAVVGGTGSGSNISDQTVAYGISFFMCV